MQPFDLQIKLLTIGDSSVGKTCLLHRYTSHSFSTGSIPTVGIDFKMMNITIDGKRIKMQCWDTAGQERYRNITVNYYRNAQGIMLVYDITNMKSYESIDNWIEQIHTHAGATVNKILVGNKVDQMNERVVSYNDGENLAKKYDIPFYESSAKTGVGVDEAFFTIAKAVTERLMGGNGNSDGNKKVATGVNLNANKANESGGGCC